MYTLNKTCTIILSFVLFLAFYVVFSSKAYALNVCQDANLNKGCPTCTCPNRGKDYFVNTYRAGSVKVNVRYLGNDVTRSFSPKVESMKPTSDWYFGPYSNYDSSGLGDCIADNFGQPNKYLTCALPQTNVSCGYAKGEGADAIKLNCLNGPFKADISFPKGYYPINVPDGASISKPASVSNINICGQINTELNWEVGYLTKPQNVKCGQSGASSMTVNFDSVYAAESYEIYRDGELIATVTDTTYNDINLTPNGTYIYTIKARKGIYESEISEASKCKLDGTCIIPSKPKILKPVYDHALKSFKVSWDASTGNVDGYEVMRYDDLDFSYKKINTGLIVGQVQFVDSDQNALVCGKTFYYKVRALGCGNIITSNETSSTTDACIDGASCTSITGQGTLKFNQTASFTAQSSGKEPLSYSWSVVPNVGSFGNPSNKKIITYKAPSTRPNSGYVELHARVSNSINTEGFECPAIRVNISEDTGYVNGTAKEVKECTTASLSGAKNISNVSFNLNSDDTDNVYFRSYESKTDINGQVKIAVELPKPLKYIVKVLDGKLYGTNLAFCPNLSTGWVENSAQGSHTVDVTLDPNGIKDVTVPVIYVTRVQINPTFRKWVSIAQGNYTIRNSPPSAIFKAIGDGFNVLSRAFGSIFTANGSPDLTGGAIGPSDTSKTVYTYADYDNTMGLNTIIDTALNYDESKVDVKDCSNIETHSYDMSKGILKYRPVKSSNCTVTLSKTSSFVVPQYSVVVIEGNLVVERNMNNDGANNVVYIVTGDVTFKGDVTIVNANIIAGGRVIVDAPAP